MIEAQLYIEGTRVDLFQDEGIELVDSIQNVRDLSKVFMPFTKSFSIPASQTNNKIFKHYYNYSIINGYDGRKRVEAEIKLNSLTFKEGKVKLEGVDLKNSKPYAYRIVFYGNTISLKDTIGEDKLTALNWLSNFSIDYTSSAFKSAIQSDGLDFTNIPVAGGTTEDFYSAMTIPLISCKTRLFYDSTSHGLNDDEYFNLDGSINPNGGNLYHDSGSSTSSHRHGVYWQELKPSIRVCLIVKAIEEQYEIEFTSDSLLKSTTNNQFYQLQMWLHRTKGFSYILGGSNVTEFYSGFTNSTFGYCSMNTSILTIEDSPVEIESTITVTAGTSSDYTVYVYLDGIIQYQKNVTNSTTLLLTGVYLDNTDTGYSIYINGETGINYDVEWIVYDPGITKTNTGSAQTIGDLKINAKEHIPDMKVIDFLSGLFKMFNLVAYKQNDGKIRAIPLDDYFDEGVEYDITEYVDKSQSTIDAPIPFNQIKFEYEGRNTKLAERFEEFTNKGWGTEEYNQANDVEGQEYVVSLPFEHMQFERLYDGTAIKNIVVGWCVDGGDAEYYGKPLLFYPFHTVDGETLNWIEDESTKSTITTYVIPLNSVDRSASTDNDTCNFSYELNEYAPYEDFSGTLYANYYQTYIEGILNANTRITKLRAKLPLKILAKYGLNDSFRIVDKLYRINSIKTNLTTGWSDLELINL